MRLTVVLLGALVAAAAGCDHAAPGGVTGGGDVGPSSGGYPRRLTYYDGDDATPSVSGTVILYSRQSPSSMPSNYLLHGRGRESCLAYLPVDGGTIAGELCPDRLLPSTDTIVDTWSEPALSPDGSRLAFVWQRGPPVGELGFNDAYLTVTRAGEPTGTPAARVQVNYLEAGPAQRRGNVATHLSWVDDAHVRFLATMEHILKVKDYGAERVTDTLMFPLALMELDVATGTTRVLPGGDSVAAYAAAPDAAVWVVYLWDSTAVWRLDPATGTRAAVGRFATQPTELTAVNGLVLAVVGSGRQVAQMDPATGTATVLVDWETASAFRGSGPARRIVAAGGSRYLLQVDRVPSAVGGSPDLFLLSRP